jgi:hypothetical protein
MRRNAGVGLRIVGSSLLTLLILAAGAQGQVGVGDNAEMTLSGNVGLGYSGNFGDSGVSGHALYSSGMGLLSGSYYNPNFLSFTVRPFYNRNQDQTSYTSILSETGVDASTSIFSGSHFPGSVSFSKSFSKGSQYGLPGSASLDADATNQNFAVSWSELLPSLPSLTATFADNSSSSTVLGEGGTADTSSKTFNLVSNYRTHGFQLIGFMNHQNYHVDLPSFLSGSSSESDSAATSYGVSASHALPLSGSFTTDYNRTNYSSETGPYRTHGSTDTADTTVSLKPMDRLTVTGQVRYTGDLIGALRQSLLADNTPVVFANEQGSHGVTLSSYAAYQVGHGFTVIGYANRQMQTFAGTSYNYHQVGGTVTYNYSRPLFGLLNFSFGMVNNGTTSGGDSLGFVGTATLKRRFGRWEYGADMAYSQNVQTVIADYTTSTLNYGGNIRRRFGASTTWSASYRGIQSGITQLQGSDNRADSFITNLARGRYDLSATYSRSHGTALLSSTGAITPSPITPILTPDQILYNGRVYGASAGVRPARRMLINFNWYKVRSDTVTTTLLSQNNSERYYAQMQYNVRKLSFRAGYWRVYQGVGANAIQPTTDNTYFFNVSRWFRLF